MAQVCAQWHTSRAFGAGPIAPSWGGQRETGVGNIGQRAAAPASSVEHEGVGSHPLSAGGTWTADGGPAFLIVA